MFGKHRLPLLAAALALSWGSTASAAETGWYFGLSGGVTGTNLSSSDIDNDIIAVFREEVEPPQTITGLADSSLDDSDKGWGVHIGYRITKYVAVEVGYLDLGEFIYESVIEVQGDDGNPPAPDVAITLANDARFESRGPFASVLGVLPVGERFDVHVRGGILFADTRTRARTVLIDPDIPESFNSTEGRDNGRELFAGVGATWNINATYGLRVEYQRFMDVGEDEETGAEADFDLLSVAILFR